MTLKLLLFSILIAIVRLIFQIQKARQRSNVFFSQGNPFSGDYILCNSSIGFVISIVFLTPHKSWEYKFGMMKKKIIMWQANLLQVVLHVYLANIIFVLLYGPELGRKFFCSRWVNKVFHILDSIFDPTSTSAYTWGNFKSQWTHPTISDRKIT